MRIEDWKASRNGLMGDGVPEGLPVTNSSEACRVLTLPSKAELSATKSYNGETYYGIPSSGHSYYEWRTSTAFLFNGIGGGSQILATLIDLFGNEKDRSLVRAGRLIAAGGGALSTLTLINSLHNWQRFYNMLRIFKKTSPMSIGIWAIGPFTALSGMAAAGQIVEDLGYERAGRLMGRVFSLPASILAPFMISYMGTELEETNVPVWAGAHPLLSPLYAASGLSNSTAAMLAASEITGASEKIKSGLNGFVNLTGTVELALAMAVARRWNALPEADGFERSAHSAIFKLGYMALGLGAPIILRSFANRDGNSRGIPILSSVAKIGGGLLMQLSMIYGGLESGRHPRDYFEFTKPEKSNGGNVSLPPPNSLEGQPVNQLHEQRSQEAHGKRKFSSSAMLGLGLFSLAAGILAWSAVRRGDRKQDEKPIRTESLKPEEQFHSESSILGIYHEVISHLDMALKLPPEELEKEVDGAERRVAHLRDCLIEALKKDMQVNGQSRWRKPLNGVNVALAFIASAAYPTTGVDRNYLEDAKKVLDGIVRDLSEN